MDFQKDALMTTFIPIDKHEWIEANLFSKVIMLVKAPIILALKLTIPLVDYDAHNHNWNKITTIVNCLIAPIFITLATKSKIKINFNFNFKTYKGFLK